MTQKECSQQHTVVISNISVRNESSEASSSNDKANDIPFKEGVYNFSFSHNNFDGLTAPLMDLTAQQKNFVSICKQELDKSGLPKDFDRWTIREQYDHLISNINKYFLNIPESLRFILPAIFEDGDCGRPAGEKPDWLDMDKFRRGQRFVQRYFTGICLSQLLALFAIFTFSSGLKPLILSRRSNTPYRAFKRYLSTVCRVKSWCLGEPWTEGTPANRDIQSVRRLHRDMRRKLCNNDDDWIDLASQIPNARCPALKTIVEDFKGTCPIAKRFHCPYTMMRMKGLNQGDMAGTQWGFMGLILLYPEQFGVHNVSDEDLEAFCYLWRGLGYLLGIEDRYNFCRGSLEDVRQRSKDFIEHWVKPNFLSVTPEWEHMSRCLCNGLSYFVPTMTYKLYLFYLRDMFGFNMPRLYNSLSLLEKIMYKLHKFFFVYMTRLPGVLAIMNAVAHMTLDWALAFGTKKHNLLKQRSCKVYSDERILAF